MGVEPQAEGGSAGPSALSRAQQMLRGGQAGSNCLALGQSWVTGINSDDEDEQGRSKQSADLPAPGVEKQESGTRSLTNKGTKGTGSERGLGRIPI